FFLCVDFGTLRAPPSFPTRRSSDLLNRYRAGEFDILTDFPSDQYQWLQDNLPGEAHVTPFLGIYYYVMNQEEGQVLSDVRIREADRKSTRLNSSHVKISYAVFCLKK